MHWRSCIRIGALSTAAAAWVSGGAIVNAQAWVPSKGDGTVSLTYQNYQVVGHYDAAGRKNNNGGTQSHAIVAEVDYGITHAIGLIVSLPLIASKYTGPPFYFVNGILTLPGPLDDGHYHAAFQDVHAEVRRVFWAGIVPVAPFVGAYVPSHDYETAGEAVPGRGRWDLQVGANAGVNLDRVLSCAYFQARYAYTTAQQLEGFPFTRSNVDLEVGYPV